MLVLVKSSTKFWKRDWKRDYSMIDKRKTVQDDIDDYKVRLEKITTLERSIEAEWRKEEPDKALIAYLKEQVADLK